MGLTDLRSPSLTEADLNITDALQDDEHSQYLPALLGTALLAAVGSVLALFYAPPSTIATLIITGISVVVVSEPNLFIAGLILLTKNPRRAMYGCLARRHGTAALFGLLPIVALPIPIPASYPPYITRTS